MKEPFIHETVVVDSPSNIGGGTKIWHFSHILAGAEIGRNCILGQNVMIGSGVKIGDGCKIQNNVSVYEGVEMDDYVFCGPSCVFTNVMNPRAEIEKKHEFRKTIVKRGASIGANATIVCGNTIGAYSFIAAGAVVTKSVPDFCIFAGTPARFLSFVCLCGVSLPKHEADDYLCGECERKYQRARDGLRIVTDTPTGTG